MLGLVWGQSRCVGKIVHPKKKNQQALHDRDERAVQAPAARLIFLRLGPKGSEQLPREGHAEAGSSGGGCVSLLRNGSVTVVTVVTVECAGAPTDRPTCGRVECDECGTDRPTRWEECGTRVGDSVKTRNAGRENLRQVGVRSAECG